MTALALIALALATVADLVTTARVLARGGRERNWFRFLSRPVAVVARVAISAVVAVLAVRVYHDARALWIAAAAWAAVAAFNEWQGHRGTAA